MFYNVERATVDEEISSARTFHGADARVAFHAWRTARIADSSFFGPLSGRSRIAAASWNAWNAFGPGQKQESERALCSLAAATAARLARRLLSFLRNVVQ